MPRFAFRLVNVFAENVLEGNPLCVFEDARGLDDGTMQALALQMNLSETTFLFPAEAPDATAKVRIFTPTFEMPFAGHPTLGSAHVVRSLHAAGDSVALEMKAGVIPVVAEGDRWTLTARTPTHRAPEATREALATMLGLSLEDLDATPLWVDAGSEQLVVPLTNRDAVERAAPTLEGLFSVCHDGLCSLVYVFFREGDVVHARFFFAKGTSVIEDPGTGSACANLGGWWLATRGPDAVCLEVHQGARTGRPCRLRLQVGADASVRVGGRVVEVARGAFELP
ncbi:MAG: PhzF family phenazine biosynthesis protein [Sandaracinus sp.]|nr:PhzF family phenazine biosynthesis protein [Sandaracinus sp.]